MVSFNKMWFYKTIIVLVACMIIIGMSLNTYLLYNKMAELKMDLSEMQTRSNQNGVTIEQLTSNEKLLRSMILEKDNRIVQLKENEEILKRSTIDANYKLFFGEWEVTRLLAKDTRHSSYNSTIDLIGTVFYFDHNLIKYNDEIANKSPFYSYYVIPEANKNFLPSIPPPSALGIEGDFSLYIEVEEGLASFGYISFYVKDDTTLILFENESFYEMKRKSFIRENISESYEHI